jgi:hypothetical protein
MPVNEVLTRWKSEGIRLVALGYAGDNILQPTLTPYRQEPSEAALRDKTAIMSLTEAEEVFADFADIVFKVNAAHA